MRDAPTLLMTSPEFFDVSYVINPWMRPDAWSADPAGLHRRAQDASRALAAACRAAGARVETIAGVPGLPDLVFPANAAVVLDGQAVMARFRHPERRGEEPVFAAAFEALRAAGLLESVLMLPDGLFHEGAGDSIWDLTRGHFWAGHGPRSDLSAAEEIGSMLGRPVVPLELVSNRFYHLDTCFCPLSGGEILYYPPAFTEAALVRLRERVPAAMLIAASPEEAAGFCVNAVNVGRRVVMARTTPRLRAILAERGYEVDEVDLSPFILAGGGAYCMTLRLDRASGARVHPVTEAVA